MMMDYCQLKNLQKLVFIIVLHYLIHPFSFKGSALSAPYMGVPTIF